MRFWCITVSLSLSNRYPGSGVVLDGFDSWSMHPHLLCILLLNHLLMRNAALSTCVAQPSYELRLGKWGVKQTMCKLCTCKLKINSGCDCVICITKVFAIVWNTVLVWLKCLRDICLHVKQKWPWRVKVNVKWQQIMEFVKVWFRLWGRSFKKLVPLQDGHKAHALGRHLPEMIVKSSW